MVIPRVNKAHGISTISITWHSKNVNLSYHHKYISIIEAVHYSTFPTFCTSISIYYEERSRVFLNARLNTAVYGLSFVVMWQLMSSTPVLHSLMMCEYWRVWPVIGCYAETDAIHSSSEWSHVVRMSTAEQVVLSGCAVVQLCAGLQIWAGCVFSWAPIFWCPCSCKHVIYFLYTVISIAVTSSLKLHYGPQLSQ
jgi:hypothetical protein